MKTLRIILILCVPYCFCDLVATLNIKFHCLKFIIQTEKEHDYENRNHGKQSEFNRILI